MTLETVRSPSGCFLHKGDIITGSYCDMAKVVSISSNVVIQVRKGTKGTGEPFNVDMTAASARGYPVRHYDGCSGLCRRPSVQEKFPRYNNMPRFVEVGDFVSVSGIADRPPNGWRVEDVGPAMVKLDGGPTVRGMSGFSFKFPRLDLRNKDAVVHKPEPAEPPEPSDQPDTTQKSTPSFLLLNSDGRPLFVTQPDTIGKAREMASKISVEHRMTVLIAAVVEAVECESKAVIKKVPHKKKW